MSEKAMSTSTSIKPEATPNAGPPHFPTETEIYILPDGRVVIADLPAELADLVADLGESEPCAVVSGNEDSVLAPATLV